MGEVSRLMPNPPRCQCGHGPSRHYWTRDGQITACRLEECECKEFSSIVCYCIEDDCPAPRHVAAPEWPGGGYVKLSERYANGA